MVVIVMPEIGLIFTLCLWALTLGSGCVDAYTVEDSLDAVAYLERFGYLEDTVDPRAVSIENFENAIREFQNFSHIRPTGMTDITTMELMNAPRCGNRDERIDAGDELDMGLRRRHSGRQKRSTRKVMKWRKSILSYAIVKFPTEGMNKLNPRSVQSEIDMAFKYWEQVTNLKFRKATRKKADISIWFLRGNHGDVEPFDGPGRTLAHGFYPQKGAVHFDDEEKWATQWKKGHFDLRTVAVHEIGHAIGLTHVPNQNAVMFFKYRGHHGKPEDFKLHQDDISSIQAIYGVKRQKNNPASSEPSVTKKGEISEEATPDLCMDPKIDAITTMADGITYAFKGPYYYPMTWTTRKAIVGKPELISLKFPGVPNHLDAVLTLNSHVTLFFKGALFWRSTGMKMDHGYPKPIRRNFRGLPNKLNAAFVWSWDSRTYFFKGDKYWRFESPSVQEGYPRQVTTHWPGIPKAIDAGFRAPDNRTYIFKGGKYWMFHDPNSEFEARSYPKQVTRLFGCRSNDVTPPQKSFGS